MLAGSQDPCVQLPLDMWRQVLLSSRDDDPWALASQQWLDYCRLVVTLSSTCKALHSALLGPDAGELWDVMHFTAEYSQLSRQQSHAFNRLLVRQAHHARAVTLIGGGWDFAELQSICASFTGPVHDLEVADMTSDEEASCIGAAIATQAWTNVTFHGAQATFLALPDSLHSLVYSDLHAHATKEDDQLAQRMQDALATGRPFSAADMSMFWAGVSSLKQRMQTFLDSLQPFSVLETLALQGCAWQLTENCVRTILVKFPRLQHICLGLTAVKHFSGHNWRALQLLGQVSISLTLTQVKTEDVTRLLWQLQGVRLLSLHLVAKGTLSSEAKQAIAQFDPRQLVVTLEQSG